MTNTVTKADVTELKSLASPPQAVCDTLVATMLLLENSYLHRDPYHGVKKMLADMNFLKRMKDLNPDSVPLEAALGARLLMEKYTADVIKAKSRASYTVYQWNQAVIEAVLSKYGEEEIAKTEPLK